MRIRFDKPMSDLDIHKALYSIFLEYKSESYGLDPVEIPASKLSRGVVPL